MYANVPDSKNLQAVKKNVHGNTKKTRRDNRVL